MIFPTPPPHPAVAIIRGGEQRFFGKNVGVGGGGD